MNKIQRELFKISAKHVIILCLRVNGDIHKIPKIYRSKYVDMKVNNARKAKKVDLK